MFADRIRKYIGSYAVTMGGVDGIIFTAGVGENSATMRASILEGLEFMDVIVDEQLNRFVDKKHLFNHRISPVKVMVIPTNEEVMIARDVAAIAVPQDSKCIIHK